MTEDEMELWQPGILDALRRNRDLMRTMPDDFTREPSSLPVGQWFRHPPTDGTPRDEIANGENWYLHPGYCDHGVPLSVPCDRCGSGPVPGGFQWGRDLPEERG